MDKFTGNDLRILREKHKLTQEELAQKLGVHRKTVGNWELEKDAPLRKTITFRLDSLFPDEPSLSGRNIGNHTDIDFSSDCVRMQWHSAIEDKLLSLREQHPDLYGDAYAKAKLKNYYNFTRSAFLGWIAPSKEERDAILKQDRGLLFKQHFDEKSAYNERLRIVHNIARDLGYIYEYGMLHYNIDCSQPHTQEDIDALKAVGEPIC